MRPGYAHEFEVLSRTLRSFEEQNGPLVGLKDSAARATFIEQVIDSVQRERHFGRLAARYYTGAVANPLLEDFDPLKASVFHFRSGDLDEAMWLLYLYVHFGKHRTAGWRYVRDVYGRLGAGSRWSWEQTSADPTSFRFWLQESMDELTRPGPRGFGNHRKYESLNAWDDTGTGAAVESYVDWVLAAGDHAARFAALRRDTPEDSFDSAYKSMSAVRRFGRVAKFDYLTTALRLGLLDFRPGHAYVVGATGPLAGARLLLDEVGAVSSAGSLQERLKTLSSETGIGPDVLEDAICNWQKSPATYVRFSG